MTKFRSGCPIASTLDLIGDRWSLVIVRSLAMGVSSYSDLMDIPEGISTNILADRLRRMEAQGLVVRTSRRRGAKPGTYVLTSRGAALLPALQELARWGESQIPGRWPAPARFYALRPEDVASPRVAAF